MRRVAAFWAPLLEGVLVLSLVGLWLTTRFGGAESLSGGPPFVLMLVAVATPLAVALMVAVQGFTLSERQKGQGDEEAAARLATRSFFLVVVGAAGTVVTIFAAGLLANPAG
ncbi:MAG: hypothetical protein WKH64_02495 [Chloroflexia bacterium]